MEDHKALALEESAAWRALSAEERKQNGSQRDFWKKRGRKQKEVEARQFLLNSQGADSFLWGEIAKGLPVGTAANLVRKARSSNTPLSEVWKSYQENGATVRANGKVFKRSANTKSGKRSFDSTLQVIEKMLEDDPMLICLDPLTKESYVNEILVAIRIAFTELRQRILRDPSLRVSRKQMMDDCRPLNLDPPAIGQPVDMAAVRKAARQKIAQLKLHPDQRGGDLSQLPLFHEIMALVSRLQQYNDQLNPKDKDSEQ